MDLIGLVNSISIAGTNIDAGRKGFATRGMEQEGRLSYEKGIDQALSVFQEAQLSTDPQAIILAEYTFISLELEFCHEADKHTIGSLTQAKHNFDDAFLALEAVEDPSYKITEKTYPHHKDFRFGGFPLDAFHYACRSHRTRLQNILRAPGIDPIEKVLLEQRFENLSAAQSGYVEKQKKIIKSNAIGNQFSE